MLIRLTEVDVYDEEEINIGEYLLVTLNHLSSVSRVTLSFAFWMEFSG